MQDIRVFIQKVLLENALKYGGKTTPKASMGAVMREFPEMRTEGATIQTVAEEVAEEINALTQEEQQALLETLGGSEAPEKVIQDPFVLPGKPILRFEPSPSGALHIGHLFPLGLNHLLAKKNDGTLILRIADTNPDNIYPQAYELIEEDAKWYTEDRIAEVIVQSDRMELYYTYAEQLLADGRAYICTCETEIFRACMQEKTACPCRDLSPAVHLERWELMKTTWSPGDAVMRIKTDVTHKNPAIRDWPAMRINTTPHPRQGTRYRVWPLMNFSVSVDDIESAMTHVLRAKDHADNAIRQEYMYNYFHKPIPTVYSVGRINFTNLRLSTSTTRKQIDEGLYSGWDDIRLPFLPALKKRGYQAKAFLRLAQEVGISKADKKLSQEEYFTAINTFNREIIDAEAKRIFLVRNPKKIRLHNAPECVVQKKALPQDKEATRHFIIQDEIYIEEQDEKNIFTRLIDAYNITQTDAGWAYHSTEYAVYKEQQQKQIIHYLPAEQTRKATLHMPDGTRVSCRVEQHEYPEGTIVQCERIGYARLVCAQSQEYWFLHD